MMTTATTATTNPAKVAGGSSGIERGSRPGSTGGMGRVVDRDGFDAAQRRKAYDGVRGHENGPKAARIFAGPPLTTSSGDVGKGNGVSWSNAERRARGCREEHRRPCE